MREVSNLATVLGNTIATLKQASANATARFQNEVAHSNTNLAKVNAFTDELASANKEVEAMLVDTGSNFPDVTATPPDKNGVVTPKG